MSNLNYGVVGNCRTAALISEKGSIDWLCFPDFDSPSIFASLLDRERGGSFGFDVTEDYHISQSYVPHTNILSTSFSSKEGEFVVLDYMPYYRSCENAHYLPAELYRYVRWIKGKPRFKVNYVPAPNYAQGKVIHNVTSEFIESYCSSDNKDRQYLYSSLPLQNIEQKKEIILEKDEFFLLSYNEKVIPVDIEREKIEYCRTLVYWLNWTNRTKKYSLYNDVIERSMLVLKLMSYYNGAVLAALTTSLPESVGEVRNWDYRFCWLRDASMSIETLFQIGHIGAARRFMKFIQSTFVSNFHPDTWTREGSIAMYRKSFEDMQVDYIDYYLLHMIGGGGMEQFRKRYIDNGMIDFLVKEREAGRIRRLGWSFHGDIEVYDYALQMHDRGEVHWDFVQIQLNYVDWKHASGSNFKAEYLYDELAKRKIPAVIMEPLLGGRLSNVPDHIVARLKQREPERSVASWAFRYAGSPQDVLTVLSGMTYMEHLQDNIRTYSPLVPLTEEETQYLYDTADLMMEYPTIPCNDCKYCMPCPYGIDIPAILIHYNKCVNEGNVPESSQDENYRKARRAFLVGYDRSVPKLRQADHCTGCNQCSPHCPQTIDIPKELHRIDKFVEQLKQETL